MGEMYEIAVSGIADLVTESYPGLDGSRARAVAELYFVLLNGLVMTWMSNPDATVPSGALLGEALSALTVEKGAGR